MLCESCCSTSARLPSCKLYKALKAGMYNSDCFPTMLVLPGSGVWASTSGAGWDHKTNNRSASCVHGVSDAAGWGLVVCALSMVMAAGVEWHRLRLFREGHVHKSHEAGLHHMKVPDDAQSESRLSQAAGRRLAH